MSNIPFLLQPAAKDYLWGGSRLNDDFGKQINIQPLAETWECSTHPDGPSIVATGDYKGMTLTEVLRNRPEFLGTHPLQITGGKAELPILVKLIDAKKDLSVQVHPDDEYAKKYENSLGKSEMWYVLDAQNDTKLVYGFNQDVTEDAVRASIEEGTIEKYLNHVPVNKNDLFFIEAGTVHAIGAGALIAEIQENSNLTYRLYDYKRIDKNGKERELHIDKAMDVANLKSSAVPKQPMRVLKYRRGWASELLTRCKYFQVERQLLNTEILRELTDFQTDINSFRVLLCTEGCGVISGYSARASKSDRTDFVLNFFKGDCIFIPANSIPLKLHGKAQLLNISC